MIAVGQIRMGVPRPDAEENDRSVRKNRRQIDETAGIRAGQSDAG
jgi:hypothetical protein